MENSTFQKIIVVMLVAIFVIGGVLFYSQQKAMNRLASQLGMASGQPAASSKTSATADKDMALAKLDQAQKGFEANTKSIMGKVSSISGNALIVEADLPDFQKMKELAPTNDPTQKPKMAPTLQKKYTVTVSSETKYASNGLDKIKAGDTISITSKELIYQTDKLTAVSVISPFVQPTLP